MRRVLLIALLAATCAPAAAHADLASLTAACTPDGAIRFCDDGVPDAGGRTPNPGGAKAIEVPAAYAGHRGLPPKDEARAATVPGNSAGNVAIDADLTLPSAPPPASGYPLVVFMHGCCAGNKTDYEEDTIDPANERWHYSNRWYAQRGYAVLTYTSRGFVTTTPQGDRGSTGETQLDHRAYEINDLQHLAGQLVDDAGLRIDPRRIVLMGGSYGGGWGWMALTDPRWRSPAGKELRLAAVVTKYGWTDLVYSLLPTGMHMPGQLPAFDGSDTTQPLGLFKRSFAAALFQSGFTGTPNANGSRHATFPREVSQALTCLNAADPSHLPPPCESVAEEVLPEFVQGRSAYYQNEFFAALARDPSLATPVYVAGTFSDQLFTAIETLRMVQRLQETVPGYPVQQYFGDYLHATQNKAKEWADLCGADRHVCTTRDASGSVVATGVNTRLNRFVDHYVRPAANPGEPPPAFDVTAALYVCKANASEQRPLDEPGERFTAPSFAALAPHDLAVSFTGDQRTTSPAGAQDRSLQADPVFNAATNGGSCPTTAAPPAPGVAVYQTEPLREDATMIGPGRVTYRYAAQTADPASLQLDTRLYDVAPDGRATLVDRGVRRLAEPSGEVTYALHGQGWRFRRGHAIRIEATQDDDPYVRRSTTPATIDVSGADLRLPVRQRGAKAAQGPDPRTTAGGAPCRRTAPLQRAKARPRGRGLRFRIPRKAGRATVSVFQQSRRRDVIGNRLVARFARRRGAFTWKGRANQRGRRVTNGVYVVRFRKKGRRAARRALQRRRGRFHRRPAYATARPCGAVRFFKLERPVFGGRRNRALGVSFRLAAGGDATVKVRRGGRTLRTYRRRAVRAGRLVRLRVASEPVPRGNVRIVLTVRTGERTVRRRLVSRRL